MSKLQESLHRAASSPGEVSYRNFYECLLDSEVFVPMFGGNPVLVAMGERMVAPVFSSIESFAFWVGENESQIQADKKSFPVLLFLLNESAWLHLDPNHDVGKEFSPWEVSYLKQGKDAIDDLISEALAEADGELELVAADETLNAFQNAAMQALEVHAAVISAFCLQIRQSEQDEPAPVIGLKLEESVPINQDALHEELRALAQEFYPPQVSLQICANVTDQGPLASLFLGAEPFYERSKT